MDIKEAFEKLSNSDEFKKWKNTHPACYIVHFFAMLENFKPTNWEIGYYSPKKDKITSFSISNSIITKPEQNVFKENNKKIEQLNVGKIKTNSKTILKLVQTLREKHYPTHLPNKGFLILQSLENQTLWNITIVTQTLTALNFKINAESMEIIEHKETKFFEVQKGNV